MRCYYSTILPGEIRCAECVAAYEPINGICEQIPAGRLLQSNDECSASEGVGFVWNPGM